MLATGNLYEIWAMFNIIFLNKNDLEKKYRAEWNIALATTKDYC